ncbi:MAG: RagB/SusD family nutrient uptake outer membrane protein [Bacteroidota bacterium]|nr:RagB/SusD family nutrient uptake outer membrane protein [Bacteroidota bacterium]MDP4247547.1 RagB/SusD family nutrient uptake outer membrane protein [Bacteroidota bacterium]MDP4257237.1 RagB/SusD family nutrient uptake outer membrane protein [Bacteroidota bacterium]
MKKLMVIITLISTLAACRRDVLNIAPQDRIAETAVWTDPNLVSAYENNLYNGIPHGFYLHMISKYSDEAINTAPCCGANIFAQNTYNPDNITSVNSGDFWGGYMYYWTQGYRFIREANIFLQKMAAPNSINFNTKQQLIGEVHFLRAFMYFNLIERYGGVPIVDTVYNLGDSTNFVRATMDQCVAHIQNDLNAAKPLLPKRYLSTDANFGRATQDACKALWSRVTLYAASPLYNTSNDMAKWQAASDAADSLLNAGYSLYPDYRTLFNQPSGSAEDEYIFSRQFTTATGTQYPMHNLGRRYGAYGGWWASNGPSQNLVDDYDMATTGEPPFTWTGGGQGATTAATQNPNPASGYDPNHPYWNRDPRFQATVLCDSGVYHGDTCFEWVSSDGKFWGFDSYKQSSDNPEGGYILKKFMPDNAPLNWSTTYTTPWPFFRLAEIYLNYAEAQFHLGNEATTRQYLNMVRARVNMPPIPATYTGTALWNRLVNERRIELAFEGHRFFDERRWLIAGDIENRPLRGMQIIKNLATGVTTYTPVTWLQKIPYNPEMNFIPIERAETKREKGVTQSPGWQ